MRHSVIIQKTNVFVIKRVHRRLLTPTTIFSTPKSHECNQANDVNSCSCNTKCLFNWWVHVPSHYPHLRYTLAHSSNWMMTKINTIQRTTHAKINFHSKEKSLLLHKFSHLARCTAYYLLIHWLFFSNVRGDFPVFEQRATRQTLFVQCDEQANQLCRFCVAWRPILYTCLLPTQTKQLFDKTWTSSRALSTTNIWKE